MKYEIEAAASFITKLINKNLSQTGSTACSSASSTHSSSSSSSESPPGFDEQTTIGAIGNDQDKVELFKQCLTEALYERFHDHWFPEQPTKGQAYRCIRLNEWDRHDVTLQKACLQSGIDYKDLQLPVELTLWVDPDEVTCRFGENKGSHCSLFKDGELRDDNSNIDIEFFQQNTSDRVRQASLQGSPNYNLKQHNQLLNNSTSSNHSNHHQQQHHNSSYIHQNSSNNHQQHHNHQQAQLTQQMSPQHYHRSNLGKAAILPSYHHNYLNGCDSNGNPIYYYF